MVTKIEKFAKDRFDVEISPFAMMKIREFVDYDPYIHLQGDPSRSVVTSRVIMQAYIEEALKEEDENISNR